MKAYLVLIVSFIITTGCMQSTSLIAGEGESIYGGNLKGTIHILTGSGKPASLERKLAAFNRVEVHGPVTVKVHVSGKNGDSHSVKVSGDSNLIAYVDCKVKGNKLDVSLRQGYGFKSESPLTVDVGMALLEKLNITGTSKVNVSGIIKSLSLECILRGPCEAVIEADALTTDQALAIDEMNVTMEGPSELSISNGFVNNLNLIQTDTSEFIATKMACNHIDIDLSRLSEAKVFSQVSIVGKMEGMSTLEYEGDPRVSVDATGRQTTLKRLP